MAERHKKAPGEGGEGEIMADTNKKIVAEMLVAIDALRADHWNIAKTLAPILSREAEERGADMYLMSIIGSWGDTLPDDEILTMIREYNRDAAIPRQ